MNLPLKTWKVGWSDIESIASLRLGRAENFREVTVPYNVQQAAFKSREELFYADHLDTILWTEEKAWIYYTEAEIEKGGGRNYILSFDGLDYCCEVYVNGTRVCSHIGMYGTVNIAVTPYLHSGKNRIWVVFYLTEEMRDPAKRHYGLKCPNSYKWDAAPRMLTMGIWDSVSLLEKESSYVKDYHITSRIVEDNAKIQIRLERAGAVGAGSLAVRFAQREFFFELGEKAKECVSFLIERPRLWYPHDLGEPYLYEVEIILRDQNGQELDHIHTHHGIRSLQMMHSKGSDAQLAPLQVSCNGTPVFIKGVNMVPLDVFPATIDRERYESFLQLLCEGGVNLVRIWGGGLTEKDCFYDLCDQMGILVWQDFPQCCENPPETGEYLRLLEDQARRIVLRLRNHCSVLLYCGGNELYVDWSRLKDGGERGEALACEIKDLLTPFHTDTYMAGADGYDEMALKLLADICRELDDTRIYHISSPLEGEGEVHGPWGYDLRKGDQRYRTFDGSFYEFWNTFRAVLYSEAGCSGMANEDQYCSVIPADQQWPVQKSSPSLWFHNAFGAAWGSQDQWLDVQMVERFFGRTGSLPDMIWASQFLQAEGIRYIIEECRRKKPDCSGVMIWAVNETWPNAASLSLLNYDLKPKAAYYAMKQSFRRNLASLRYDHVLYEDTLTCGLWVELADAPKPLTLNWKFYRLDGSVIRQGAFHALTATQEPCLLQSFSIEAEKEPVILAELAWQNVQAQTGSKNVYCFANGRKEAPFAPLLEVKEQFHIWDKEEFKC